MVSRLSCGGIRQQPLLLHPDRGKTTPLQPHPGKEWDEIIFMAVGMGMHSQFCFLLLIQSNMLSVITKTAIFIIETWGLVTRYIYSENSEN